MGYEPMSEEQTRQQQAAVARMPAEAMREHLEELIGADVSLRLTSPVEQVPLAEVAEGLAPDGIGAGGEPSPGVERADADAMAWSCFRMTGSMRGRISIGAAPVVVRQLMQLAMSEPVDTGTAEEDGRPAEQQLSQPVLEAWRGLLADALRPMGERLRSAFGWNALLVPEPGPGPDATHDCAELWFALMSGGLKLPLVVRTFLEMGVEEEMPGEFDGSGRPRQFLNDREASARGQGETAGMPRPRAQRASEAGLRAPGSMSGVATGATSGATGQVSRNAGGKDEDDLQATELEPGGMGLLMDIELEATLRFGSRELSLQEVLSLGPGGVIELDRHVSEPVDLVVADKIVARGEVVLVNGNFGLRVTEVAAPQLRLESIRCLF